MSNEFITMTMQDAVRILKSDSYVNFSKDQLLAAVEFVKGDTTQTALVDRFYKSYFETVQSSDIDYNEYAKLHRIFAGTTYSAQLDQDALAKAEQLAGVIQNDGLRDGVSFAGLDQVQALFAVVPQNNVVISKLNDVITTHMDSLLEGKTMVGIAELEAAQHLADNMADETKQALVRAKLDEIVKLYDDENGLNKEPEVLRKNDSSLSQHLESIALYQRGNVAEEFKELLPLVDKIELLDDNGTTREENEKQDHLTMLFEAAKLEAHQQRVGDLKYLLASKKDQRARLVEDVKELFMAKIGQAGIASTFERPSQADMQDEAKFKAYLAKQTEAATSFVEKLVSGKDKMPIRASNILIACADTDIDVSNFNKRLEARLGGESKLNEKISNFREKAVALWGKRYEFVRSVVQNVKSNWLMHTFNTAATIGVVAAGGYTLPIVGAYAAYTAVGAVVWPVVAEAQKQRQEAKCKGEELGLGKALSSAWKKLSKDKNYKTRAALGATAGIVGACMGLGGANMGLNSLSARVASGLLRSSSSVAAQSMAYINARKDWKKNPSDENKSKLKAAKISLGVGAVISAAGAWFSISRLGDHAETVAQSVKTSGNLQHVAPAESPMSTPMQEGWGKLPKPEAPVVDEVSGTFFPEQYDADMGITSGQYRNLLKLYSQEDLDRMYSNLDNSGFMKNFDGMTKEQVLFKWSKLDAYTDRVRWNAEAQQYITIPGAERYHFDQEMRDLSKMLNCGDRLELMQITKIKSALGVIDDRGGYHGPGYVPTDNYHVQGAGVDGPCDEGQTNHFNGSGETISKTNASLDLTPTQQSDNRPDAVVIDAAGDKADTVTSVTPPNLQIQYGESQYNLPNYQPAMAEGVGTFAKEVDGKIGYVISGPHGQHPIIDNAITTTNAATGDVLIQDKDGVAAIQIVKGSKDATIYWGDGRAPETVSATSLRQNIEKVTQYADKPVLVEVPYTQHASATVSDAAALNGCKVGELTKTSVFNGTSQFKMYTENGIVNVRVGKDSVPHFSMEELDGTTATTVPSSIVKERFQTADNMLRDGQYTSLPAKTEVGRQILKSRVGR